MKGQVPWDRELPGRGHTNNMGHGETYYYFSPSVMKIPTCKWSQTDNKTSLKWMLHSM